MARFDIHCKDCGCPPAVPDKLIAYGWRYVRVVEDEEDTGAVRINGWRCPHDNSLWEMTCSDDTRH